MSDETIFLVVGAVALGALVGAALAYVLSGGLSAAPQGEAAFRSQPEQPYLKNHEVVSWTNPRTGQYHEIHIDRTVE